MIRAFSGQAWQSDCLDETEDCSPLPTGVEEFPETCSKWVLDRIEFRNGGFQELNSQLPNPECFRIQVLETFIPHWPCGQQDMMQCANLRNCCIALVFLPQITKSRAMLGKPKPNRLQM